jgi:cysteinyl-tRNA synthetase
MAGRRVLALLGLTIVAPAVAACAGDPGPSPAPAPSTPDATAAASTVAPGNAGIGHGPKATPGKASPKPGAAAPGWTSVTSWVYQLQDYAGDGLTEIARAPHDLAVVDLARDAKSDYFRPDEVAAVRAGGKRILAYFEIGSIEDFRPEYPALRRDAGDLIANEWDAWPGEYFVRYWDERWWDLAVRPRIDRALHAGFDGVYLDTPLAYEEIDLGLVPGETRDRLGARMAALIVRISAYAKQRRPGFGVFPQNSPELRRYPGYTKAIDGIGMEELFYLATDQPCTRSWCAENLRETRALRAAGKLVLAVDYATAPAFVRDAHARYAAERFAGCVTVRDLDRIND